jgi:periplasmic protein TonB
MLGAGLTLAAQQQPESKGVASDIAPPGLPSVTSIVEAGAGGTPGGLTDGTIGWIINSAQVVKPRIAAPQRVRVAQGITQGLLVSRVDPEYPPEARRGRIEGTVVLHAIISKTGDIDSVEVVSGHPALAPAAIEAVKQWKYKPYLLNGKPVAVDTQILVNFTLSGN